MSFAVWTNLVSILNLLKKLDKSKRILARFVVRESDLKMQIFLRKQGFIAVKVSKGKFKKGEEDGYVMVKSCLEFSENIDE